MAANTDFYQLSTDTSDPEVAKLLIAHNVAMRNSMDQGNRPNVERYLEVFDKVYKGLKATTAQAPAGAA
jgi:hypothetical protein